MSRLLLAVIGRSLLEDQHQHESTTGSPGASHAKAGREAGEAVVVEHLRKTYAETVAVDDVSFSVAEHEVFGILGPNGAGKTTTVECAIGLRTPDSGSVRLMGLDPRVDRAEVHAIVGAQLQASALQPNKLRVAEILDLYRSFYRDPADAGELLAMRSGFARSAVPTTRRFPVARSSGFHWPWRSSAGPGSRSSTR